MPELTSERSLRIRVVSQRLLQPRVSRCCGFEFENVITAMTGAELIAPRAARMTTLMQKAGHHVARLAPLPPDRISPPVRSRLHEPCDLLVAVCQFPSDLSSLAGIRDWRSRSGKAVCFIEEIWARQVGRLRGHLRLLNRFDHVFTSCSGTVGALQARLDVPCSYLPPGVDALRFCPVEPGAPQRTIDITNIGRRSPAAHALLRRTCEARGWFYYHDTYEPFTVLDPGEHRALLASIIQRTRYFVANRAKPDRLNETSGQEEIGFRYFEATAGGAVLIGDHPRTAEFDRQFGWEDAVIRARYDGKDLLRVIDELESSPQRAEAARRRNIAGALTRHDWAYRWMEILRGVGLEPQERVVSRISCLRERAAAFMPAVTVRGGNGTFETAAQPRTAGA